MLPLSGFHHLSSLSAEIRATRDFYVRVLGLRPIITTVNQDDPTMYHLFFADGVGSPGSDMTVFDLPHAGREQRGNNSITQTSFRVSGELALQYWVEWLAQHGVPHHGLRERDGRAMLEFDDPVGTRLMLIDDRGIGAAHPWEQSPVPAQHQIRGLGHITITVPSLEPTDRFLRNGLDLQQDHTYGNVHVYRMAGDGVQSELHVIVDPDLPRARYGSGGVHHVALRVSDEQPLEAWVDHLSTLGYANSGIVDRHYFTSIYVREPNHILFELATDGPGFEVDGAVDPERVTLPPFLEPRRAEIEARLSPL